MESEREDPQTSDHTTAQAALDSMETDRQEVARRITAQTWWVAPAQGAGIAVLVTGPAMPSTLISSALGLAILFGVEYYFRKKTKLTIKRPAGPIGILVLVLVLVLAVMVGGYIASMAITLAEWSAPWIVLVAAGTFVLTTALVVAYDRAYAREVQRVR